MVQRCRHIKYHKITIAVLLLSLLPALPAPGAPPSEGELFQRIVSHHRSNRGKEVKASGRLFLRRFPRSSRVADVRFYMAENEEDVTWSLAEYRRIIKYYRYFRKRDYVYYRICQISFLRSDWKAVRINSEEALNQYPRSPLRSDFLLVGATAALKQGRLEDAEKNCRMVQEQDHRYSYMARTLLLLASIEKKKTGFSRAYVYALREIILGFKESSVYPTALFLTGEFYLHHGDTNRAWTAFSDLVKQYPRAPESNEARRHIRELKKGKPRRVSYYPDNTVIKKTDPLDISPERDIQKEKRGPCYSLAVGPFHTQEMSNRVYRLVKGYGRIKSFRTRKGFTHYIGCHRNVEGALQLKVRLAEEMGINGNIARVNNSRGRNFIYGDDQ